jgi:hypothetical protein
MDSKAVQKRPLAAMQAADLNEPRMEGVASGDEGTTRPTSRSNSALLLPAAQALQSKLLAQPGSVVGLETAAVRAECGALAGDRGRSNRSPQLDCRDD